jgi:hypothetical protein
VADPLTRRLLRVSKEVGEDLETSMQRVRRRSKRRAAQFYGDCIRPVVLELASGVVWPIWAKHPSLGPPQVEGDANPGVFDPSWSYMPKAEVRQAARVIDAAYKRLYSLWSTVEESSLPQAEKQEYELSLRKALAACSQAAFNVRQQHPHFSGPDPREDPLRASPRTTRRPARRRTSG